MKNTKIENKKIVESAKKSRIAGIQIQSGVKAGRVHDFGRDPGGASDPGGLFDPG